jgi:hypothetical protein
MSSTFAPFPHCGGRWFSNVQLLNLGGPIGFLTINHCLMCGASCHRACLATAAVTAATVPYEC